MTMLAAGTEYIRGITASGGPTVWHRTRKGAWTWCGKRCGVWYTISPYLKLEGTNVYVPTRKKPRPPGKVCKRCDAAHRKGE